MDRELVALLEKIETTHEEELIQRAALLITQVSDYDLVRYYVFLLLQRKSIVSFQVLKNLPIKPRGILAGITIAATETICGTHSSIEEIDLAAQAWAAWLEKEDRLVDRDLEGTIAAFKKTKPVFEKRFCEGFLDLLLQLLRLLGNEEIISIQELGQLCEFGSCESCCEEIVRDGWWESSDGDQGNILEEPIDDCSHMIEKLLRVLSYFPNEKKFDMLRTLLNGVENKRDFFRWLFPAICLRMDPWNKVRRGIGSLVIKRLASGMPEREFIQKHAESIMDSTITCIRTRKCFSDPKIPLAVIISVLVRHCELSIGSRIDIVRCVLSLFKPRDTPIWALKVLRSVSGSLSCRSNDSDCLTPDEMIAHEIIGRIKYLISTDYGKAQTSLEKSIHAVLICFNSIRVFSKLPQVQIVKLCEVLDQLNLFVLPCSTGEETQIRLMVLLQVVPLIFDCDSQVCDFLSDRFEKHIWPLLSAVVDPKPRFLTALHTAIEITNRKPGFVAESTIKNLQQKFFLDTKSPQLCP
jgi:hypothetical protein